MPVLTPAAERSQLYQSFKTEFITNACTACRLCETRQNIVFDRGNPEARVMMIGEAPGAQEDEEGISFVGRSGKLLDELMASIGLDTNRHLLIASAVKCRPPKNRKPRPEEVSACFPVLERQFDIVQPELVLVLGATAFKRLFPEVKRFSMGEEAGKFRVLRRGGRDIACLVLFHPAYLLYDPRKKEQMRRHLLALKRFLVSRKLAPAIIAA